MSLSTGCVNASVAGCRHPSRRFPIRALAIAAAVFALCVCIAPVARSAPSNRPSQAFLEAALCVHSGWHYSRHRPHRGARPDYWLWGHGYWRTWDVSDRIAGGSGEGGWDTVNSYGGGMQFTLGTWNNAARWSSGAVPHASSNYAIAHQPPRIQLHAAFFVVMHRGSWADWPQTSRACGLL